jgi:hypothetical protein
MAIVLRFRQSFSYLIHVSQGNIVGDFEPVPNLSGSSATHRNALRACMSKKMGWNHFRSLSAVEHERCEALTSLVFRRPPRRIITETLNEHNPGERWMYGTSYHCEHCGHKELTVKHTYVLKRTYENWIPCCCKKRKSGIAAQHFYTQSEIWHELGYLEDGRSKIYDRTLVDRQPVEGAKRLFHCQGCLDEASEYDWETVEVGEPQTVEGPDAWMVYCHRCKTEIEFGWTEPDRKGFLVPVSNFSDGIHHVWGDPGFQYRQESSQNLLRPRPRKSRSAVKRRKC